jgi:Icc-related predicted phosphoesterase
MTKIVAISDTHTKHGALTIPECDILIHAGDFSHRGKLSEVANFAEWLAEQPAKHKVVIAGNHERTFDTNMGEFDATCRGIFKRSMGIHYLEDTGIELEGLKIWGTPWTPRFCDWAFNGTRVIDEPFERGVTLTERYNLIPNSIDILICHGPPYNLLDETCRGDHPGSDEMLTVMARLDDLKLFVCGHIHEGRGIDYHMGVPIVNACSVNSRYEAGHPPVIIHLDADGLVDSVKGFEE